MGTLMKCGHSTKAVRMGTDIPVCAICLGITPDAEVVEDSPPDLSGRRAKCTYRTRRDGTLCTSEQDSSSELAFFEHRPDKPNDAYYCGCWGWD